MMEDLFGVLRLRSTTLPHLCQFIFINECNKYAKNKRTICGNSIKKGE